MGRQRLALDAGVRSATAALSFARLRCASMGGATFLGAQFYFRAIADGERQLLLFRVVLRELLYSLSEFGE
eukprot:5193474-Pyramimonas_sp.AAC.1